VSSDGGETAPGPGAKAALVVLVALAVLSPWAIGSVDPPAIRAITVVSLATAVVAFALDARRGQAFPTPMRLWPLAGLWLVGVAQIVPLPAGVHAWLAPGSAAVWHPDNAAAAAVLGKGPHPISIHPEATRRTLAFGTGILALALAAAPALRDRRLLLRACATFVAGATAVSLYAVVARLVFGVRLYGIWAVPTVAPFGPFVNKNHFAGYVELAIPLAFGLASGLASESRRSRDWLSWIESRRARLVVLAFGAGLVLVLAVAVSRSRGGFVSLIAGFLAFVALQSWPLHERRPPVRRVVVAIAVPAVLAIALWTVLPEDSRDRILTLSGVTGEASGAYRIAVWRDTLVLARSSLWLGSGLGAFEDAFRRFKTSTGHLAVQHAESEYLELAAEAGLAGVLLASIFATSAVVSGLRMASRSLDVRRRALAAGAVAGLTTLAVHAAIDFNLRIPSNALAGTFLLAVVLAGNQPASRRLSIAVTLISAVTAVLLCLTPANVSRAPQSGVTRAAERATPSLRRDSLEQDFRVHLGRRPADATAWLFIAWIRMSQSPAEGKALAAWASGLDPANEDFRSTAELLARTRAPQ
jgi:hypothetical protein